jgi:formamidopyrimidine-DNA glycosylase
MPELPEVETVRRGLEPVLAGRMLAHVDQRRSNLRWPFPERFAQRLTGRRVTGLGRRSKYLLIGLDGGETWPVETWIVHLGMSGRILVEESRHAASVPGKHDHVIVTTDRGLAGLGPEPLGNAFNGAVLAAALADKRTPVKAALLDQRIVAGLGNIYVSEALHRAGISPKRMAGTLSRPRIDRLAGEIVATLNDAIAAGGSSLRDYRQADGELGYFQHSFRVYDREGAPCPAAGCSGTIRRIVQSGRSTFHCPKCQR